MDLIMHCGAHAVPMASVYDCETPGQDGRHFHIPHSTLLDTVRGAFDRNGWDVANEAHGLTHDGARYFGLFEMAGSDGADHATVVGIRNSHDKTFSAGLVMGSGVFVCDNLAFSGEVKIARKHTRNILRDLDAMTYRAVGSLGDFRDRQEMRIQSYKQHELTDLAAHDFLVRSIDAGVIPPSRLPRVLEEWRTPTYRDFEGNTLWNLFNAFTETMKGGAATLLDKTRGLHCMCDLQCGLAA